MYAVVYILLFSVSNNNWQMLHTIKKTLKTKHYHQDSQVIIGCTLIHDLILYFVYWQIVLSHNTLLQTVCYKYNLAASICISSNESPFPVLKWNQRDNQHDRSLHFAWSDTANGILCWRWQKNNIKNSVKRLSWLSRGYILRHTVIYWGILYIEAYYILRHEIHTYLTINL